MLKKSITYTNPFTGQTVTEEHYFHISKADLIQMQMEDLHETYTNKTGQEFTGMQAKLQRMIDSKDGKAVIETVQEMIRRSYGLRVGDSFRKSQEIWDDFAASEAYSQLIWDLTTDAENAGDFLNHIFPAELAQMAAEAQEKAAQLQVEVPSMAEKVGVDASELNHDAPRVLTTADAMAMDPDELQTGLVTGRYKLGEA